MDETQKDRLLALGAFAFGAVLMLGLLLAAGSF